MTTADSGRDFEAPDLIEVMEEAVVYNRFLIRELERWAGGAQRLLDFGAGNGRFCKALLERGFELVEVPDDEFDSMGCNVLATAPRVAVAVEGNPETKRRMEAARVEVHTYAGQEISQKGCGGPTCLTRTLERGA